MEPTQIWAGVFEDVRQELAVPMVWLAMQAVKPLLIDGSFFVAALPKQEGYLAGHLQDNQATTAIEDALRRTTGRILAFRLIEGETAADWEAEKAREAAPAAEPPPAFFRSDATPAPAGPEPTAAASPQDGMGREESGARREESGARREEMPREVSPTWEKLTERLNHGYKSTPFVKYPHGQAQYVLTAIKLISDTMDAVMPPPGAPRDDTQERLLAKMIERLSGVVNLDPMFLSLELLRYRELHGKNRDAAL